MRCEHPFLAPAAGHRTGVFRCQGCAALLALWPKPGELYLDILDFSDAAPAGAHVSHGGVDRADVGEGGNATAGQDANLAPPSSQNAVPARSARD